MTALIDHPAFQALLPWAKAWAEAEQAPQLALRHVLLAAEQRTREGQLPLPDELQQLLQAYAAQQVSAESEPTQPVDVKRPVGDDLRAALANGSGDLAAWLLLCVQQASGKLSTSVSPPATPAAQAPEDDPVFQDLKPWLVGARRCLDQSALTADAVAMALQAALRSGALDSHIGFAHWVEGHLDELSEWLTFRNSAPDMWEPAQDDAALDIHTDLQDALDKLHPQEHAPTALWKWAQATVQTANDERRQLQVAYHEAGHTVALHVLSPETVFTTVTIQPEGNISGHVASTRNSGYNHIYMNSLEHALESIVALLAGRAAEVRQFGECRADSGAVNDIQKATGTAWTAITSFGLDPDMGMVSLAAVQQLASSSSVMPMATQGWLNDLAQQRLHTWLRWGNAEATALVEACWPLIDTLARTLMRQQTLDNDQTRVLLGRWRADAPPYRLRPLPTAQMSHR